MLENSYPQIWDLAKIYSQDLFNHNKTKCQHTLPTYMILGYKVKPGRNTQAYLAACHWLMNRLNNTNNSFKCWKTYKPIYDLAAKRLRTNTTAACSIDILLSTYDDCHEWCLYYKCSLRV